MSAITQRTTPKAIKYPDCDGKPIAENTLQFEYIVTLKGGFDALYADDPNVFVAGDLLWYPVEGQPTNRMAPDVLLAFGRPKGYRGSYLQWLEGGIAPQVVFEVLSPGNRPKKMQIKFEFYERYGVEEYYVYDPDRARLEVYVRDGDELTDFVRRALEDPRFAAELGQRAKAFVAQLIARQRLRAQRDYPAA